MWRILSLPFLTASSSLPDPIKAGETLAQLDLTQQALFAVIFVVVCLVFLVFYLASAASTARKDTRELSKDFGTAATKMVEGGNAQNVQTAVQLALIQVGLTDIKAGLADIKSALANIETRR